MHPVGRTIIAMSLMLLTPQCPTVLPEVRQLALEAFLEPDFKQKVLETLNIPARAAMNLIAVDRVFDSLVLKPGCPERPSLVSRIDIRQRSPHTREGLAALLHAVAHIEFNAINLALDAVWRFADMPLAYYQDWMGVAADEARHFAMLQAHLQTMEASYGDFPAHTGLWDMAEKTAGDVLARMALVPRTLEARGLDATPPMQKRLRLVGTFEAMQAVDILEVILKDEVGHVAIGNRWYRFLCARKSLEPVAAYAALARQYQAPRLRAPLNLEARSAAGFTDEELAAMTLDSSSG